MTEEEVYNATRAAQMYDRIMSFPDKFETRVGERGQRLSGGEKQRGESSCSSQETNLTITDHNTCFLSRYRSSPAKESTYLAAGPFSAQFSIPNATLN